MKALLSKLTQLRSLIGLVGSGAVLVAIGALFHLGAFVGIGVLLFSAAVALQIIWSRQESSRIRQRLTRAEKLTLPTPASPVDTIESIPPNPRQRSQRLHSLVDFPPLPSQSTNPHSAGRYAAALNSSSQLSGRYLAAMLGDDSNVATQESCDPWDIHILYVGDQTAPRFSALLEVARNHDLPVTVESLAPGLEIANGQDAEPEICIVDGLALTGLWQNLLNSQRTLEFVALMELIVRLKQGGCLLVFIEPVHNDHFTATMRNLCHLKVVNSQLLPCEKLRDSGTGFTTVSSIIASLPDPTATSDQVKG
ncbi:hypothetical protein ACFPVT_00700 [Corynebacterium choanae]|uniref:Uncharacterized protein n=1 Tax=Corynebacterium choanae TaxID=1862358 RepID=A0A3G6J8M2_9CORY|nr:hypothetical protein [Corynebacterium choanae]AZA13238.1 hypothetical protein CCHOA_04145 [Corynebacterium choanae]